MGNLKAAAPPKPRREFKAGDVIHDRYELVRPLGEGGMGVVWIAQSLMLDVPVAIKLIHADLRGTAVAERMAREARAAAKLGHPAIARVLDFGKTADNQPYMAMELLHGESLADALDKTTRLSATKAIQSLLPIADGLATAHDKGIVHRDLKPDNIFLARDEVGRVQPKLLDFGIAKSELDDVDRKLTQEGTLLGSPDYMSPEQAYGQDDIDHHSDIWQFCVVLYECITGRVPFVGKNYNALLRSITKDDPQPITDFAAGDAALWRVIERGLKKDKLQRWSSMWELGEALALWLYEQGVREDVTANSLRKTWLESGISGVQMDLDSDRPPVHDTLPPASRRTASFPGVAPAPLPPSARLPGNVTLDGADVGLTTLAPPAEGVRRKGVVLGGASLLLAAGALGWFVFAPAAEQDSAREAAAVNAVAPSATVERSPKPGITPSRRVATPSPSVAASAPTEGSAAAPSTERSSARPMKPRQLGPSKAAPSAPPASPAPAARPAVPADRDFGF